MSLAIWQPLYLNFFGQLHNLRVIRLVIRFSHFDHSTIQYDESTHDESGMTTHSPKVHNDLWFSGLCMDSILWDAPMKTTWGVRPDPGDQRTKNSPTCEQEKTFNFS